MAASQPGRTGKQTYGQADGMPPGRQAGRQVGVNPTQTQTHRHIETHTQRDRDREKQPAGQQVRKIRKRTAKSAAELVLCQSIAICKLSVDMIVWLYLAFSLCFWRAIPLQVTFSLPGLAPSSLHSIKVTCWSIQRSPPCLHTVIAEQHPNVRNLAAEASVESFQGAFADLLQGQRNIRNL